MLFPCRIVLSTKELPVVNEEPAASIYKEVCQTGIINYNIAVHLLFEVIINLLQSGKLYII